ncbi:hypothetical protein TNIN_94941 [Trichonephila inaurata madagascariensis]|uniref:Uncharacterized protein n=1 Tax=Trichonephila inaurata madagascariensis TaxID=2747483 RepID=A0A8X7C588_9ARAC|nr:hypothetical protein TNIN_94941 [Trichonephila inaurata madagascariensis]
MWNGSLSTVITDSNPIQRWISLRVGRFNRLLPSLEGWDGRIHLSNGKRRQEVKEESETEETVQEEVFGCRDFQPMPREMQNRRKDRLSEYVGFYDSLFEKPEMWEEGVEFQNGLGKDVWGIVQRYLRQDLV